MRCPQFLVPEQSKKVVHMFLATIELIEQEYLRFTTFLPLPSESGYSVISPTFVTFFVVDG